MKKILMFTILFLFVLSLLTACSEGNAGYNRNEALSGVAGGSSSGFLLSITMPSEAMKSTIMFDARIVFDAKAYERQLPQRFDIIVFKRPSGRDDMDIWDIKRIIGLPGEIIEIREGKVFVNDDTTPLDEVYVTEMWSNNNHGTYEVPEGAYFVLGDNRDHSHDSRYMTKALLRNDILGKVILTNKP